MRCEGAHCRADGSPLAFGAALGGLPQPRLELRERGCVSRPCWTGPLQGADDPAPVGSWVEVRAIGWKVEQNGSGFCNGRAAGWALVAAELVHERPAGRSSAS